MRLSNLNNPLLLLFLLSFPIAQALDTNTVSITAVPEFAIGPACVQSCVFYNSFGVADYLLFGLGCTRSVFSFPFPFLLKLITTDEHQYDL